MTEGLGTGSALPRAMRARFEKSLGRDLSAVRVHTGDAAADRAADVQARAFASGMDIVFGRGEYRPDDRGGQKLLAHEVAHTAQQRGAAATTDAAIAAPAIAGSASTASAITEPSMTSPGDAAIAASPMTSPGDAAERDADSAAAAMVAGKPAAVSAQPLAIARKTLGERTGEPSHESRDSEEESSARHRAGASGSDAEGATAEGATVEGANGDDDDIGELTADRVGLEPDEGDDVGPDVPVLDIEGGKQEIAAAGQKLSIEGGAERAASGGAAAAGEAAEGAQGAQAEQRGADGAQGAQGGAGEGAAAGGAAGEGGSAAVSPEIAAAVVEAQRDARDAAAQSETESTAYQAEVAERRDRFEAEQHAVMLEKLKSMSPIEKRQTLQEMGYDPKKVKKLKDSELDALIEGRMDAEARKTKILGMTPEELAKLSPAQKTQYLVDLGIDRKDLDKAGQGKATGLFDNIMKVAHVPGQHKVKIQIKGGLLGKSWEVTVKCDAEGTPDIEAEKKGGFLSKLWGWVKLALPILGTVLGPLTAGASLIAVAVYQTVTAIRSGDWLGALIGVAGGLVSLGALAKAVKGASAAAKTLSKVASVAEKVKKAAEAAQLAMQAAKAKNAGSLLGALAAGAQVFAGASAKTADKFAQAMQKWAARLDRWSKIISGGEKVVQGIKKGDPLLAIGGAFDTAIGVAGAQTATGKALTRATAITSFVNAGKQALAAKPPDYAAVAQAALGIAGQLHADRRIDDASRIIGRANALKQAWERRATDPNALIDAALGLAEAIQLAKYDLEHDEDKGGTKEGDGAGAATGDGKTADGKTADGKPTDERAAITARYQRAGRIVHAASAVLKAATAHPPSYTAALDGATQLIADLTDNKQIDAAAVVTSRLDAYTKAVNSKDPRAILEAGVALGQAIDGLRTTITQEHANARRDAEAQLPAGQILPDDGGAHLPPGPSPTASPDLPDSAAPTTREPRSGGERGPHGPMDDGDPPLSDAVRTPAEIQRDQLERRKEGGRARARSQLGDLESDWAGRTILERYLLGDGDIDYTDDAWAAYMMRSEMLRAQMLQRIRSIAMFRAGEPRTSDRPGQAFSITFHAEIDNGEGIVGYQYLHGTEATVGDFQLYGHTTVLRDVGAINGPNGVPGETIVEIDASYRWNDRIDSNPRYTSDRVKNVIAEIISLGMANPYRLSINWSTPTRVHLDSGDRITSVEGWPGESKR